MIKRFFITCLMVSSLSVYADEPKSETTSNIEKFPMIFSEMEKNVGEKDTLDVFIPKDSYLMSILFDDIKVNESVGVDYAKLRRGMVSRATDEIKPHIIKMVEKDNGRLITLNLKGLKPQSLIVSDDQSANKFITEYVLVDGKVMKINLILSKMRFGNNYADSYYNEILREYSYLANRYSKFLDDKHYKKHFTDNGFSNSDTKRVASIQINASKDDVLSNITLTVMDKDVYENYSEIMSKLADKSFDAEYTELNDILK